MKANAHQTSSLARSDQSKAPAFDGNWCFFLDVDGTLLDIADRPDAVAADAGVKTTLRDLQSAAGGAVALISGRPIADIDRLFDPLRFPVAGQHGFERRDHAGNRIVHAAPVARLHDAAKKLEQVAAEHRGLLFENKGATLALHFRLAPDLAPIAERAMHELHRELGPEFELQPGKMLVEIKPGGKDKGTAIAEFMAEPPFRGRTPVFIGDDVTDEYGFALVNRRGGHSVKVGAGTSAAEWRLADAQAVRAWLRSIIECYSRHAP